MKIERINVYWHQSGGFTTLQDEDLKPEDLNIGREYKYFNGDVQIIRSFINEGCLYNPTKCITTDDTCFFQRSEHFHVRSDSYFEAEIIKELEGITTREGGEEYSAQELEKARLLIERLNAYNRSNGVIIAAQGASILITTSAAPILFYNNSQDIRLMVRWSTRMHDKEFTVQPSSKKEGQINGVPFMSTLNSTINHLSESGVRQRNWDDWLSKLAESTHVIDFEDHLEFIQPSWLTWRLTLARQEGKSLYDQTTVNQEKDMKHRIDRDYDDEGNMITTISAFTIDFTKYIEKKNKNIEKNKGTSV